MKLHRTPRNRSSASAFSLIEVVLALGVVSFGLMSLMGTLLVGLRIFDQAVSTMTQGEIAQQVANRLQQSSYPTAGQPSQSYFYSQEGTPAATPADSIFTATVSVPEAFSMPGSGSSSSNLQRVRVDITSRNTPQVTNSFTIHLANNRL